MIKNYIKTALRSLIRHKEYSIINILGLAVGMASVILILLFVKEELSFDQYHKNKDHIYRLNISVTNPQTGVVTTRAIGPYRLTKELKPDFPDIPHVIRIVARGRELVRYQDKQFYEEKLVFADPDIFQVFTFPLLKGDPANVLNDPFSVVVTEEAAGKYFGDADPLGQVISLRDRDFRVTGILGKTEYNTQFEIEMLVSLNVADQLFSRIVLENWGEGSCETYAMLPEGKTPEDYEAGMGQFVESKLSAWREASPRLEFQPLSRLYLYSKDIQTLVPGGDITYVYAFTAIALFILIIACINFMNLATARSANRAKEVGLRKVVGAERRQLISQFLSESIVLSVIALIIACILVMSSLPAFNQLADKELSIVDMSNASVLIQFLLIALFVGVVAGTYPAFFLSSFRPVNVLSGQLKRGVKGGWLRRILVVFQFAISIFLIVVTVVVNDQLGYARNLNLGFDKENLVLIQGTPQSLRFKYDLFRQELLNYPNIINAAPSSRVPPDRLRSSLTARPEGIPEDQHEGMQTIWTDFDFIETMGFELAAGRAFSREYATDATAAYILNESGVKKFGWTNETAIGKGFASSEIKDWQGGQWERRDGIVVGVLKDFHFESVHQTIVPTVYFVAPIMAWNYVIRIDSRNIPETLDFIKEKWDQFNPGEPFIHTFVEDRFEEVYRTEEKQGQIFAVFAIIAIFVACLGLVGLSSFTAEQRTKEVGIRKVLGATVSSIVLLISREFITLILIAFAVSAPIAWYFMNGWLQNFAYHVSLGVMIFIMAGLFSLVIALMTVSFHAVRVALSDPANVIRYE